MASARLIGKIVRRIPADGAGPAAANGTRHWGTVLEKPGMEYSIQQVSDLLGIPVQKLRRWDDLGVLTAARTEGGHRRYSRELIDKLAATAPQTGTDKPNQELAAVRKALAEKHRIIQLLLESENRYRDLVETSHDLIWTTDGEGRFTYLNGASHDIFDVSPKDLLGRCFFDYEAGASHISNRRFLALLKRHGEVKNYVTHVVTARRDDRWIGINARVVLDDNGTMTGIRGTARDITEQHLATRRIEHLALHDALTDLPNRHCLQRAIENALRDGGVGALLFLDVDHFKYVNDHFGHRTGDQLIVGVGSVLRDVMIDVNGELYRLGGDEFAIHLPAALRAKAVDVAERALEAVRRYRFQAAEQKVIANLSASAGIALYPFHGNDVPALLSNVDIAMYQAKEMGRNRCMVFDQSSDSLRSTHKRVHWAKKLRDALDEDRLVLFSQPVVRLADAQPVHHEVLVRLRDEDGRYVTPGHFIEFAESLGVVKEIDMRVVEKLLRYMHERGEAGQKIRYFVNLSRVSIADPDWVRRFVTLLETTPVRPSQLAFEITETAAMSEIDVTLAFIRRLKSMGCRFALDDFGAGFSSFYYLKRFDVDYLKIDGSFIGDLAGDDGGRVFVKALNGVARELDKQVVAEWVETPQARAMLLEMGVQFGQGYLFQHPVLLDGSMDRNPVSATAA